VERSLVQGESTNLRRSKALPHQGKSAKESGRKDTQGCVTGYLMGGRHGRVGDKGCEGGCIRSHFSYMLL
jgi:hypothetical protein